jgi:hypothetical protein
MFELTTIFVNTCPLFCILNLSMFTKNESQPLKSLLMHVVHELQQEVFVFYHRHTIQLKLIPKNK